MIPRDYQQEAVSAARQKTDLHGNTMLVLPTGSGKTAIAGFYIGEEAAAKPNTRALILQHTDELIGQNCASIGKITGLCSSVVKAEHDDWSGQIIFGSIQTLGRERRRQKMVSVSHLVIDECHRSAAESYQSVITKAREINPEVKLLGLSATPGRGDGRSLRKTFSNVAYQLPIGRLIKSGILVPPRTYTIDLGVDDELAGLDATAGDFDMRQADRILNRSVLNEAVVDHWKKHAQDRQTIMFCATVAHADAVASAFRGAGYAAEMINGDMPAKARTDLITKFNDGDIQILTNCMVLTEGFDSQPVGCIGILRPMLHKGTFIQAVGRGLRRVDPERFPGIVKTDCLVLDFAGAALRHGTLEQEVCLDGDEEEGEVRKHKTCPGCEAELPISARVCPLCGHSFARDVSEKTVLTDFELTEIDLLTRSPFAWHDLDGSGEAMMASGFNAWSGVFFDGQFWHALGRAKNRMIKHLAIGSKEQALAAADDYLRLTETSSAAEKSQRWLHDAATAKQRELLRKAGLDTSPLDFGISKYGANCQLNFLWNLHAIRNAVFAPKSLQVA
jgi:DNA repair protein RadD